jgi:hypothetical protein
MLFSRQCDLGCCPESEVYRLSLHKDDLASHRSLLKELMQAA